MRLSKSVPSNVAPASRRLSGRHPAFPFRLPLIFLCVALPLSTVAGKTQRTPPLDPGYLFALATADHYLQAWQSGDVETGMALLTNHAKEKVTTDILEDVFSAPGPLAYEIGRGKMLRHGRYEFPVVLVGPALGSKRARRRFSQIVVLNTGNNDWTIDKLP
ncbi:MAG: hypothetical protein LAO24_18285 [Acidobacteriia bacterium]|nr:hypothetical protein [Terriglobia bacterium]